MMLKVLDKNNELNFIDNGDVVASLAAMSIFSFPGIPTCEENYMKYIGIFFSNINFVCIEQALFL